MKPTPDKVKRGGGVFPAVLTNTSSTRSGEGNASPESESSIPSLHASLDLTSILPLLQLHLKTITIYRPKDYASKPTANSSLSTLAMTFSAQL
ncbi:hypothetical protein V6N12_042953 [Hibiscus sabdariffa]|uniref:Uncharacterized protein n=1 Tax=Hibiscus sabdariffa TaxID=183260 RepID=A0ABR2DHT1_9ROSI